LHPAAAESLAFSEIAETKWITFRSAAAAAGSVTFSLTLRSVRLSRHRKWNRFARPYPYRREADPLRLSDAVLAAQDGRMFSLPARPVFMSEPARDCWNIHTACNAARRKQVPQIVMDDARHSYLTRSGGATLASNSSPESCSANRGFVAGWWS